MAESLPVIGLFGGMSWESSAQYYRIINEEVRDRLGPARSAECLLYSVDFGPVKDLQHAGDWKTLTRMMVDGARRLEAGGAAFFLICTNTMHLVADEVAASVSIPLIHIADPTGAAIRAKGHQRVALLGTAFTMEQPFYRERLAERFGLDVLTPPAEDRAAVHDIIYRELIGGIVREESRQVYRDVVARLVERGAEAVIMGCTEIMLLLRPEDSAVPLFDTTRLHARAAVERALGHQAEEELSVAAGG